MKSNRKINIKRDKYPCISIDSFLGFTTSFLDVISELIERTVLLKRSPFGYWNNVNSNLKIIPSAWISLIVLSTLGHMGLIDDQDSYDLVMIFGAAFTAHYFAERNSYYSKWSYLAQLYVEMMKAKPYVLGREAISTDIFSFRDSLEMALAHDIVVMEMWSHSSFSSFFREAMLRIMQEQYPGLTEDDCIKKINRMRKKGVLRLIEKFHNKYSDREFNSYKDNVYSLRA